MNIELLAPAGNKDALIYAIEAGADAIYLGGKSFGARAYSNNFSDEELIWAIEYAHLYGVKVYVTCNTLIYDNEVDSFIDYVRFLHKNNVDAILLQDIGMLDLIRKKFPNLEVHASTQMNIHNTDGVKLLEKLGVKRVVLSREVDIDTIKEIKKNTNAELEVFIHGSLCLSYSGECLMSYFNGGRSGNRGMCAGSCRLPYKVNNSFIKDKNYPLSTKDLNTLDNIGELLDLGVNSLKIEGRMKSREYVYLVVSLYKEAITSYLNTGVVSINPKKLHDLRVIFNRGYTKGFIFNEDNSLFTNMLQPNHQGIEIGKVISCSNSIAKVKLSDDLYIEDGLRINDMGVIVNDFYINNKLVKSASKGDIITIKLHDNVRENTLVYKTSSMNINRNIANYIKDNKKKVLIDVKISAHVGKNLSISVSDGKNTVSKESIVVEKSINKATTSDELKEKMNKLGNSVYKINNLDIEIDDNSFIPLKVFNELRHDVIEELNNKRLYKIDYVEKEYSIDVRDYKKEENTNILISNKGQYDSLDKSKYNKIYSTSKIDGTIYKLPRIMHDYNIKNNTYLVGDIGALLSLKNVDTDFNFNVVNSYSVAFLHSLGVNKVTLSYELSYNQVEILIKTYVHRYNKHPNVEVIISSNPEVMISKFSLNKYFNKENIELESKFRKYIALDNGEYMSIYNKDKLIDNNNYFKIGVNNVRINEEVI